MTRSRAPATARPGSCRALPSRLAVADRHGAVLAAVAHRAARRAHADRRRLPPHHVPGRRAPCTTPTTSATAARAARATTWATTCSAPSSCTRSRRATGTIAWVHADNTGTAGNMLQLTGDDGWIYWYIHINNDTPGTDDGKNPARWRLAPGIHAGSKVKAGQFIAYMGDSGDAEGTQPHLHFEIHTPERHGDRSVHVVATRAGSARRRAVQHAVEPGRASRRSRAAPATGRSAPTAPCSASVPRSTYPRNAIAEDRAERGEGAGITAATSVAIAPTATGKGYWVTDSNGADRDLRRRALRTARPRRRSSSSRSSA